jgi:hypothetical protein
MAKTFGDTCREKVRYSKPIFAFFGFVKICSDGEWHYGMEVYQCNICHAFHLGHKGRPVEEHLVKATRNIVWKLVVKTLLRNGIKVLDPNIRS